MLFARRPIDLSGTPTKKSRTPDKFEHVRVDHVTYSVPIRHAYRLV